MIRTVSAAIEIRDLVMKFGRFVAVDHLNLAVQSGELFGFLGPNGAGKTTTIRMLIGGLKPTAGDVRILGHSITREFPAIKPLFGYVPDSENHIDEFTGRENLQFFADLYDVPTKRIADVLDRLELTEAADLNVADYSKGMRRKLLIAREILHEPRILYLDEPTANLDAHSTELVRQLLRDVAAAGTTVFLTTHNMKEVEAICDRVAILCRGRLVACDTPAHFIAEHHEHRVRVQYEFSGRTVREYLTLDDLADREQLSTIVREHPDVRMHSEEFDFADVFLKLTGQAYA